MRRMLLLLPLRWRYDYRHRVPQLHHIVYQHFDEISPRRLKLHLPKNSQVCSVQRRILQGKFHLTLSQDCRLVGAH